MGERTTAIIGGNDGSGLRIGIPKPYAKQMKVKAGDTVILELSKDNVMTVIPASVTPRQDLK